MIEEIDQPECFKKIENVYGDVLYYQGSLNGNIYGYLMMQQLNDTEVLFHSEFNAWSKEILKESLEDFKTVKQFLNTNRVKRVVAVNPDAKDERWGKFISHFGFSKPEVVQISSMEV